MTWILFIRLQSTLAVAQLRSVCKVNVSLACNLALTNLANNCCNDISHLNISQKINCKENVPTVR